MYKLNLHLNQNHQCHQNPLPLLLKFLLYGAILPNKSLAKNILALIISFALTSQKNLTTLFNILDMLKTTHDTQMILKKI